MKVLVGTSKLGPEVRWELFKPPPHSAASRYYGSCSLTRDCEGCLLLTWAGCTRNNGCGWGSILHIVTHVNIYSDIRGAAISSKCAVRVDCCQAGGGSALLLGGGVVTLPFLHLSCVRRGGAESTKQCQAPAHDLGWAWHRCTAHAAECCTCCANNQYISIQIIANKSQIMTQPQHQAVSNIQFLLLAALVSHPCPSLHFHVHTNTTIHKKCLFMLSIDILPTLLTHTLTHFFLADTFCTVHFKCNYRVTFNVNTIDDGKWGFAWIDDCVFFLKAVRCLWWLR